MDEKTVAVLAKNSALAKEIYERFLSTRGDGELFRRCFHLRPTTDGVTIVSTLPEGAMRGVDCKPQDLEGRLGEISDQLKKLTSDDSHKVREALTELGFKRRPDPNVYREEDVQARFIRGMVKGEAAYQGIQFVASELNLEDANRFDVVGVKGDTLYIFELKRGRETAALGQVKGYCDLVRENKELFLQVLKNYPNLSVPDFSKVQGVAVMKYAENSSLDMWKALLKGDELDGESQQIWFFEDALAFPLIL